MIEIQLAVPEELTLVLQAERASLATEVSMAAAVTLYFYFVRTPVTIR